MMSQTMNYQLDADLAQMQRQERKEEARIYRLSKKSPVDRPGIKVRPLLNIGALLLTFRLRLKPR